MRCAWLNDVRTPPRDAGTVQPGIVSPPNVTRSSRGGDARGEPAPRPPARQDPDSDYCPSTQAKINGATMVASLSTMNFGVFWPSLPQVIFSFGTAPE